MNCNCCRNRCFNWSYRINDIENFINEELEKGLA